MEKDEDKAKKDVDNDEKKGKDAAKKEIKKDEKKVEKKAKDEEKKVETKAKDEEKKVEKKETKAIDKKLDEHDDHAQLEDKDHVRDNVTYNLKANTK